MPAPVIGGALALGGALISKKKGGGGGAPAQGGGGDDGFFDKYGGELIGAGGNLLGAYMQSRSSNKATDASAKSTAAALAFAREQEAYRQRSMGEAAEMYKQQWNARQARIDQLLGSYGFKVPEGGGAMMGGAPAGGGLAGVPGAVSRMPTHTPPIAGQGLPVAQAGGVSLQDVIGRPARPELGDTFNWNRYGLA